MPRFCSKYYLMPLNFFVVCLFSVAEINPYSVDFRFFISDIRSYVAIRFILLSINVTYKLHAYTYIADCMCLVSTCMHSYSNLSKLQLCTYVHQNNSYICGCIHKFIKFLATYVYIYAYTYLRFRGKYTIPSTKK